MFQTLLILPLLLLLSCLSCTTEQQWKETGKFIEDGLDTAVKVAEIYATYTQVQAEKTIGESQKLPEVTNESANSMQKIMDEIKQAAEPHHPKIREVAVLGASQSPGPYHLRQAEILWEGTRKAWKYVNDPRGFEYFAKASETLFLPGGDCDDFAILLVSLIEAIGGRTRIVIADGVLGDHAYVEVWIGSTIEQAKRELKTLEGHTYQDRRFWYRTDKLGYWANFDWFAEHTGGPYFVAQREFHVYLD